MSDFYTSLFLFTAAMASRGMHHGGVSVNPHDFAPNHTGSVFGKRISFRCRGLDSYGRFQLKREKEIHKFHKLLRSTF